MTVRAVVFDVGETLIDETGVWHGWADWLGVPRLTFAAVLGAVLARGGTLEEVFACFRPDFDLAVEEARRTAAGVPNTFGTADLYPDARPALSALRELGLVVGIAGNQPAAAAQALEEADLPADFIGISELWGVAKPEPAFFVRVAAEASCALGEVLYVGDRVDNDVRPAHALGMPVAFLRRGPWGHLHADDPDAALATYRIRSLTELPVLLGSAGAEDACHGRTGESAAADVLAAP